MLFGGLDLAACPELQEPQLSDTVPELVPEPVLSESSWQESYRARCLLYDVSGI